MSNSVQHKLSAILEATFGTTPATPAMQLYPITGTSLALSKGKIESATIRPDRQVSDVRHGNRQVGGDISAELSYGAYDVFLEALFCGTWAGNILTPGVVRRSFTVMRQFTDIASGDSPFQLFKGVEFNKLSLVVAPEKIVEATLSCFGRELVIATVVPTGETEVAASTAKPFDSFTGSILVDGVAVGSVTEIQLSVENGITPRFVVFNDKSNAPKIGKCRVTGTLTTYFENSAMLIAFNGAIKKALQFTLTDLSGNSYVFDVPAILPMSGATDVKGEDDITIPIQFAATVADNGDPAIKLTRVHV